MTRAAAIWVVACLASSAVAADAPDSAHVRGESATTRKRLVEAEQKILAGKTGDAVDELLRILDDVGDTLVSADGKRYQPARQFVHQFLAKLPPAELQKYRDRVEDPAAKLLARGRADRDDRVLLELLDRYAVSRPAEEATLLLAELAFERGEFSTAERYWQSLLTTAEPPYPGRKTPAAALEAKIVLATAYRGDRDRAAALLDALRKTHPAAEGRLAGRTGNLAETLALLVAAGRPDWGAPAGPTTWTTLGGSPTRDGRTAARLPRQWPSEPTWRTAIPTVASGAKAVRAGVEVVKSAAFHPIILGRHAYVADAGRVIAFNLADGAARVVYEQNDARLNLPKDELRLPNTADADFTLTAAGDRLYVRLGHAALFPTPEEGEPATSKPSLLVCLRTPAEADDAPGGPPVVWQRFPPAAGDGGASWEGSPVVVDGRVLAAFARSEGGRTIHAVACYRDDGDRPAWVTDVCEATLPAGRARHGLLTLAGRNVVFCSEAGAIVAVNATTGRPAWAYRYPRVARPAADGRHRDLSPPVAADGRVFVAPNDGDRLFAFDAESGRVLWEEGPIFVDHVLGVSAGKVVAAIAGPQRGLRAFDAATGSCDPPLGWANHDDPSLPTFGRGLLSDDLVAWPTSSPTTAWLYMIRLADGTVAGQPARGLRGNLAFGRNVLIVAAPTEVRGYVLAESPEAEPTRPKPALIGAVPQGQQTAPTAARPTPVPALADKVQVWPATDGWAHRVNVGDLGRGPDGARWIVGAGWTSAGVVRPGGPATPLRGTPATAMAVDDRLVLANADTVSLLDPSTGRDFWTIHQPDVTALVPIRGGLVLRVGERHLIACELASGKACWALDAQMRPRLPDYGIETAARVLSVVPFGDRLLVQLSTGRRWVVNAATGKPLVEAATADRSWRSPPARYGDGRLVVADGPGQATAVDATGRTLWRFDAGRDASLTGDPADVCTTGAAAFVFVERNHGTDVERLSLVNGTRLWRDRPAFVPAPGVRANAAAADEDFIYFPTRDRLYAFKLDTGREAWQAALPHAADWRAVVARDRVLLLPRAAVAEAKPLLASFLRHPTPRRATGLIGTWVDDNIRGTVPILLFDPRTGRLQQRLDILAAGPVSADVAADGVWVAAGGAIYRLQ